MTNKTEERYARATRSSHLELKRTDEAPGDADTLIAAGLAETMGILLARLRSEWDTVSEREIQQAGNSATARLLIAMNMRSMRPAAQSLLNFAIRQAPHKACNSSHEAIQELCGRVLDQWLDKTCHHCDGRGFTGGYGTPRVMCVGKDKHGEDKCGGSGTRRAGRLSENDAEQAFGLWLLNVMESRCNGSMSQVQRKTRNK